MKKYFKVYIHRLFN